MINITTGIKRRWRFKNDVVKVGNLTISKIISSDIPCFLYTQVQKAEKPVCLYVNRRFFPDRRYP